MVEVNPVMSLIVFGLILGIILLFIGPKYGLIALYKKAAKNNKRVMIEDSLKHVFDYEYHGLKATLNSIAGNLEISTDKASKLVESLKKLNLVKLNDQEVTLTDDGRSYALRIIRIHRLWENYLAEETGIKESDWHEHAELIEHSMTQSEADALSAKMGNPKFDPHGDPIPTPEGKIPDRKGKSLNSVDSGQIVKITHIEDEPKVIYTQLIAQGLFIGKEILIVEKSDSKMKIAADGEEQVIAALLASKVTVEPIVIEEFKNEKLRTLVDLKPGEQAEIYNIAPTCRGQQRRRLLDFGIVPEAEISVLMKSPLNDPTAYVVKDTIVALRKEQAKLVLLKS